mmetsp:Transcript_86379/g.268365  ORF Transcript_86379/g.268365 Transcript_86379/m.268365 type:complete len:358 (-) Transcript_86379:83-1156(-)
MDTLTEDGCERGTAAWGVALVLHIGQKHAGFGRRRNARLTCYGCMHLVAILVFYFAFCLAEWPVSKAVALAMPSIGHLGSPGTLGGRRSRPRRCRVCGARVLKRPKILGLAERYRRGENGSKLVARFMSDQATTFMALMEPQYHTWHSRTRRFHKELSESLAVIDELQDLALDQGGWHVVDLCCGKSLTSALVALPNRGVAVTAVDRVAPQDLPHYADAGVTNIEYLQWDVLASGFVDKLRQHVEALARPTAVLGMHLCGRLSERATEAFRKIDLVRACVLAPCCLPHSEDAPPELAHLYNTGTADADQFRAWGDYLEAALRSVPGATVTRTVNGEILSPRRTVLVARKAPPARGTA